MLKYKLVAMIVLSALACTPKKQGGSCTSAVVRTEGKALPGDSASESQIEIESLGGFLEMVRYDKPEGVMCTALVEIDDLPVGATELPVTVWTAKHCMVEAQVKEVKMRLSTKNVDGEKAYVLMPIKLNAVENLTKLKSALGVSGTYERFAASYGTYSQRNHEAIIDMAEEYLRSPSANSEEDEAKADLSFSTETNTWVKAHLNSEKLAFGRSMCSDRRAMDTSGRQKFCFTHEDLGAYQGKLILRSFRGESVEAQEDKNLSLALVSAARRQAASRDAFEAKLKSFRRPADILVNDDIFGEKKGSVLSVTSDLWKQSFRTEYILTSQIAYLEACATGCDKLAFQSPEIDGELRGAFSEADRFGKTTHLEKLAKKIAAQLYRWNDLVDDALVDPAGSVLFHTNVNFRGAASELGDDVYFDSVPLGTLADGVNTPLAIRPYGMVFWSELDSRLKVFKSDSGSLISLGGVVPLAVVSSINNGPTSGGLAVRLLPRYRSTAKIARSDGAGGSPGNIGESTGGGTTDIAGQGSGGSSNSTGLPESSNTTVSAGGATTGGAVVPPAGGNSPEPISAAGDEGIAKGGDSIDCT